MIRIHQVKKTSISGEAIPSQRWRMSLCPFTKGICFPARSFRLWEINGVKYDSGFGTL